MQENIPLKDYTTMRLGGPARYLAPARTEEELVAHINFAKTHGLKLLILGEGSNLIVRDEGFSGLVILNRISGFEVEDTRLTIGSGEYWDSVVSRSVDLGLSGIEALSAIPGFAGAAPVQNIGAYGQEVSETIESVQAYDLKREAFVSISNLDCSFSYRQSIFNNAEKGRFIITKLIIRLKRGNIEPPLYESLQSYLNANNIQDYSPASIRQAVIAIRATKLPNPKEIANAGSFFKNPIIESWQANGLREQFSDVPLYDMGEDHYKVPAAWLIDNCELKGFINSGMRVYEKNPLVVVNDSATSYKSLDEIRDIIRGKVRDKFRINLEQEPEEIEP